MHRYNAHPRYAIGCGNRKGEAAHAWRHAKRTVPSRAPKRVAFRPKAGSTAFDRISLCGGDDEQACDLQHQKHWQESYPPRALGAIEASSMSRDRQLGLAEQRASLR
jgi:hypothetical protein